MDTIASFGESRVGEVGVLLARDRFLLALGMGTGPADHLPCQERSRHSVKVSRVLLVQRTVTGLPHVTMLSSLIDVCAVCAGLALGRRLPSREEARWSAMLTDGSRSMIAGPLQNQGCRV